MKDFIDNYIDNKSMTYIIDEKDGGGYMSVMPEYGKSFVGVGDTIEESKESLKSLIKSKLYISFDADFLKEKEENIMADFNEAFDKTMGHEGGYVNDPDDAGGETYRGISRVYNPQWAGWKIIDETKPDIDFDRLDPYVRSFYKEKYWDVNLLDKLPQKVANEMFDTGVNMGTHRAAKFFQESLNYLNRNESLFNDLVEDGKIGPNTMNAFYKLPKQDYDILWKMLNVCQGRHYMEYMKKSPIQEKYARGWFKRVGL